MRAFAVPGIVPQEPNRISFTPRGGPPGTEVAVRITGLPPVSAMAIGFGGLRAGYRLVADGETDAEGNLSVTLRVPPDAPPDLGHYIFVFLAQAQQAPLAISEPFHVTGPDGVVRVRGSVTDEGTECPAVRGANGELYMLVGATGGLVPGREVVVEGTIADGAGCGQGLTIDVRRIQAGS